MIQIIQLKGTERKLYQLVAPFVMDPEVLRKNNNYPFKTGENYVWFIAIDRKKVVGFIPVEMRKEAAIINNYYVDGTADEVLSRLTAVVVSVIGTEKMLLSVAMVEDRPVFESQGFVVEKEWKLYVKMRKG